MCRAALSRATLEHLVTDQDCFALTTATDEQRAIFRAIEGRPLGKLAANPNVLAMFGGRLPEPGPRPREVVWLAGVRGAKSLTSAAASVRWSQSCDLSVTRLTDTPRINIVSVDKDKARVVLDDHLLGTMSSGRLISSLYVDHEPESLYLRHPCGRTVDVRVVAGKRAGASLVSRWSAGTIFDEAPRMVGDDDGVVNLDDARAAVLGRLLPGAQALYIGSPYAPFGPVYDLYSRHFGNPSRDFLVIKAPGPLMNPLHWTPERCEETRRADPEAYRTDVLGEFLTPEEALFPHLAIEGAVRRGQRDIEPDPETVCVAAMDPATRGNAWTLCISGQRDGKRSILVSRQWIGTTANPLSPAVVLHEIAALCHRYRIRSVWTDQHSFDALRDIAAMSGLSLAQCVWSEAEKSRRYLQARTWIVDGEVELPDDPVLLADLRRVQRKAVASGIRIVLPETGDGRHCDFAPAVVLALTNAKQTYEPEPKEDPAVKRMRADADTRFRRERWT